MNPDELRAFLERRDPALLGTVATLREDGFPHVVPVWYRWDGEAILIWSDGKRTWPRNLMRDPHAAFSVQEGRSPYPAFTMRGLAAIRKGRDEEILGEIRRIVERYVAAAELDTFLEEWTAGPQILVRIEPAVIRSWGAAV